MKHMRKYRWSERGFSLIELMIVIAIIGILIGVGVPAWRLMVRRGNEAAATRTLQTIRDVQADYALGHRGAFGSFDELIREGALDERFKGDAPISNGYIFTLKVAPRSSNQPATYSVNADPQVREGIQATGRNHFYIDPNVSTIRVNSEQPATASDPPIGQ